MRHWTSLIYRSLEHEKPALSFQDIRPTKKGKSLESGTAHAPWVEAVSPCSSRAEVRWKGTIRRAGVPRPAGNAGVKPVDRYVINIAPEHCQRMATTLARSPARNAAHAPMSHRRRSNKSLLK